MTSTSDQLLILRGRTAILAASFLLAIVCVCITWSTPGYAAPPRLASPTLARQLQQRVTLAWDEQEVGAALKRLADVQRIPLWIDRRIDPHARVSLAGVDLTLSELMDRLAGSDEQDWGWTALRTVIFFGPRQTAGELATLSELARESLANAPPTTRRRWLTQAPWEFPRLSQPSDLFAALVADAGSDVRDGSPVPHDLWPACSLPAVPPVDRAALILAGFDRQLSASRDGRRVRAAPVERPVQLTGKYPVSDELLAAIGQLAVADKTIRVRRQGRQLTVAGRWEVHQLLRRTPNPAAGASQSADGGLPPARRGGQRSTLRIANKPVGAVLDQLSAQLRFTVVWDPDLLAATPPPHETLVSCEVRDVDLDGLLKAVLAPAKLAFERNGDTVTIHAAP